MERSFMTPAAAEALRRFVLPAQLGFGAVNAPVMFSAEWRDQQWGAPELLPYGKIELWPGSRALHYGELVFEGLKAYRVEQERASLFRPMENFRRMEHSALRLSMPPVPQDLFFLGLHTVTRSCEPFIPGGSGQALYLRPFLFGTESGYLLRNSMTFRFMVIANPVEAYASGAPTVAIERHDVRAAPGGVGGCKVSANYAAALRGSTTAVAAGHAVALWLDAASHRYIQELSGMNFFALIEGALHTPQLDGAILPGVTRDSLITLARHLGIEVHERLMDLDELLGQISSGQCSEMFACGTAAIVMPIAALVESDGRRHATRETNVVAARLRTALLAIQERRAPDPFGWIQVLE